MPKTVISHDIHGNKYEVPVSQLTWRPAAYGIVIQENQILLTKQYKTYHLPGGGVEFGEMPEASVIREVKEETGLAVENPRLVGEISGFFTYAADNQDPIHFQSVLLYYRCDFAGGKMSIEGFEADEKIVGEMPEWIPTANLGSITAGSTIDWRAMVKKALL